MCSNMKPESLSTLGGCHERIESRRLRPDHRSLAQRSIRVRSLAQTMRGDCFAPCELIAKAAERAEPKGKAPCMTKPLPGMVPGAKFEPGPGI